MSKFVEGQEVRAICHASTAFGRGIARGARYVVNNPAYDGGGESVSGRGFTLSIYPVGTPARDGLLVKPEWFEAVGSAPLDVVVLRSDLQPGDKVIEPTYQGNGHLVRVERHLPAKPELPTVNGTIIRHKQRYGQARAALIAGDWFMINSGRVTYPNIWQDGWEVAPTEPAPLPSRKALADAIRGGVGNILTPRAGDGDMVRVDSALAAARVERLLKGRA